MTAIGRSALLGDRDSLLALNKDSLLALKLALNSSGMLAVRDRNPRGRGEPLIDVRGTSSGSLTRVSAARLVMPVSTRRWTRAIGRRRGAMSRK